LQISLPAGIAGVGLGQPLRNGEVLAVGLPAGDLTIYEIDPLVNLGEDHGEISSLFETPVSQCIPKLGGY
jgi:hypothetical protein